MGTLLAISSPTGDGVSVFGVVAMVLIFTWVLVLRARTGKWPNNLWRPGRHDDA